MVENALFDLTFLHFFIQQGDLIWHRVFYFEGNLYLLLSKIKLKFLCKENSTKLVIG